MNLCVVSTFDCTVEDFTAMVEEFDEEMRTCVAGYEIGVVGPHKVMIMLDVTDMDVFTGVMASPKMKAWDAANNCVDVVYGIEQIN